jgi:AraC-like DNA-binding protein
MINDLTLLHANHQTQCIATVDKVFGYHTIQLMTHGGVELFYDDQSYMMNDGWFWPCYPGPHIRFHESPAGCPWEHRYIAFTGPQVLRWEAAGLIAHAPMALREAQMAELVPLFDEMLVQMNRPGRWGQARAINLLEAILLRVAEQQSTTQPNAPAWVTQVMDQLSELNNVPDYKAIAAKYHLSLTTLRRNFRLATGTTLHQYRLDYLITEARHRLGNTNLPIKQIADELGYQDVYYFTRQFTQAVGISPARFRRSRQT